MARVVKTTSANLSRVLPSRGACLAERLGKEKQLENQLRSEEANYRLRRVQEQTGATAPRIGALSDLLIVCYVVRTLGATDLAKQRNSRRNTC